MRPKHVDPNGLEPPHQLSGTEGSNPVSSSGESANFQFLARCDCDGETRFIALAYGKFESSSLQRRLAIG